MSAASDQKLFCELCSAFNCSFDEFVGEKVVSPAYSSAILAPPPTYTIFTFLPAVYKGSSFTTSYKYMLDWEYQSPVNTEG